MTTTSQTESFTCNCAACGGKSITAPAGYITGRTPRELRSLVHNYVANAYSVAPIAQMLTRRAGIETVTLSCSACEDHDTCPLGDQCGLGMVVN